MYYVVPIDRVKVGTRLKADGGFTCLNAGEVVTVEADSSGDLFVMCCGISSDGDKPYSDERDQEHYLEGQEHDDVPFYVGLRRLPWHLWLFDHLAFCLSIRKSKGRLQGSET